MDLNLSFDNDYMHNYHSSTQIARVLTESWMERNMFCPRCGNYSIKHFKNNKPVADFYCPKCHNEYELKSKNGKIYGKVNDGAYETMIQRITGNKNPDFLFMSYSKNELLVKDFIIVPKHFFTPEIIEKRKPLSMTARRTGWVGCNILIDKIPEQGRISIISQGIVSEIGNVVEKVNKSKQLEVKNINLRGWIMDILNCVNAIPTRVFTLNEMYYFEKMLQLKHPQNNNIRAKIRQQLQFLRDAGFIVFCGNGKYEKII